MQTLDINNHGLPDLQFVLLVIALSTSELDTLNVPVPVREILFNRCWALLHDTAPPKKKEERILDLRQSEEMTLDALIIVIRQTFDEYGISQLTWDHPPSEPTRSSTPEAQPLVERLQNFNPGDSDSSESTQN